VFGAGALEAGANTPAHVAGIHVASVTITPPPIAASALEACAAELAAPPAQHELGWDDRLLAALAAALLATAPCGPLEPPQLQRCILLCHVYGRLCRRRNDATRLRMLAFEITRHRTAAEPALLAALCAAWPAPLALSSRSHLREEPCATRL
jgi:hypothetical protein